MARPNKDRKVCGQPKIDQFEAKNSLSKHQIDMTIDEFECLRLIDFEGFTQEQCAKKMDVARTTIQAIYASARYKVSRFLVLGEPLKIQGGDVEFCEEYEENFACRKHCLKHTPKNSLYLLDEKEKIHMRIAVTYKDGDIFQHFGRSEFFKIYDVQEGVIKTTVVIPTNGKGHSALGGFLRDAKIDALICGGIGGGARNILESLNIKLYPGVSGNADEACKALIAGNLDFDANHQCNHHDHEHGEGHDCGEHDCGSHCH